MFTAWIYNFLFKSRYHKFKSHSEVKLIHFNFTHAFTSKFHQIKVLILVDPNLCWIELAWNGAKLSLSSDSLSMENTFADRHMLIRNLICSANSDLYRSQWLSVLCLILLILPASKIRGLWHRVGNRPNIHPFWYIYQYYFCVKWWTLWCLP